MQHRTPDTESLYSELARLRKNEGFIQRRLTQVPVVDEVLRGSVDDTFERLKSRFISAIYSLTEDEASLLLDVYALSPETTGVPRLRQRREIHGSKIERGIETVATREEAALKHLHSRLVTGAYPQSPLVLHVPEMHGGVVYEHASTLVVVENRRWKGTREHYRFANMIDGLEYVTISRSYPAFVNPQAGGDFKVNCREVEGGGWSDHFWHIDDARTKTEPMQRSEVYDLKFSMTPEANAPEVDIATLTSRALHERALLFSLQVAFIGEKPSKLWKHERVSPFARPTSQDEYNAIELDERGVATLRLRDVYGGLFSGVAWEWL